jgi:hypothetical protein
MKTYHFLLFAALLSATACIKMQDGPTLPPETQQGLNTFGCYVDDEIFLADATVYGTTIPIFATYNSQTGYFYIDGINDNYGYLKTIGSVIINVHSIYDVGNYSLDQWCESFDCDYALYRGDNYGLFIAENGILIVTKLDTLRRIISGRFNFTGENNIGEKKEITRGVFDVKY